MANTTTAAAAKSAAPPAPKRPPAPRCPTGYVARWDNRTGLWDCAPTSATLRQAQQRAAAAAQRQQQARERAIHGKEAGTPAVLRSHVAVAAGAEVRIIDALIAIGVSALTVLWTATRTPTGSILWAVFWTALGGLMAVEGRGELRYAGFGVSSANAAYASLRLTGIAKANG